MIGGLARPDNHNFGDVGTKQMGATGRAFPPQTRFPGLGVVHFFHSAGDLGVAFPGRQVLGSAVEGESLIPKEVKRFHRLPHAAEPHITIGELNFGPADSWRAVPTKRGERVVLVRVEQ